MFSKQICEPVLAQYSYLIGCQARGIALVIDPLRDVEKNLLWPNGPRWLAISAI